MKQGILQKLNQVIHRISGEDFFRKNFRHHKRKGKIIIDSVLTRITPDQALLGEAVRTYGSHHPVTESIRARVDYGLKVEEALQALMNDRKGSEGGL